jgi:hypothetical protein
MINKGTNYLTKKQQEKLDAVIAECNRAINEQNNRQKVLGYGLDDYTEGRIVGSANLARRIKRIVFKENI